MHELSLAQSLVEQIVQTATDENATRISKVVVVIGALSGVEPAAFELAFPLTAEATTAEGAELVIEERSATACCMQCNHIFTPVGVPVRCDACGSDRVSLQGGRDFLIRSIELEVVNDPQTN